MPGFESRHNTLYWTCREYIGIGPSAHSFYHGERYFCNRNINDFYEDKTVSDGAGGDPSEYIMLALRLKRGLVFEEYQNRFGTPLPAQTVNKLKLFADAGYMELDGQHACFTPKGFLLSNSIISEIL